MAQDQGAEGEHRYGKKGVEEHTKVNYGAEVGRRSYTRCRSSESLDEMLIGSVIREVCELFSFLKVNVKW